MLATFAANRRSKAHDPIHPFRRVGDRRADLRHIIAAGADCQRGPRFSSDVIGADLGWPDIRLECASWRSEEHTSELQSLMRISYAVFCLKKKSINRNTTEQHTIYIRTNSDNTA